MSGDWRDVEKWGTQFVLNATPAEVPPEDEDAMLRYLAGGVLPGVGKVTAGKLVAHFGAGVFEALDRADAEAALRECPGVGAKTAAKLKSAWDQSRGRRDATAFLEKHGIAPALAQRVAAAHGAATESRVRADPFGALAGVRGATFHRCDALAARLGKAPDDRARLAAAMLQTLQSEARSDGHSYLPFERLTEGVARIVGPRQPPRFRRARSKKPRISSSSAGISFARTSGLRKLRGLRGRRGRRPGCSRPCFTTRRRPWRRISRVVFTSPDACLTCLACVVGCRRRRRRRVGGCSPPRRRRFWISRCASPSAC